jgi:hypothetical protein
VDESDREDSTYDNDDEEPEPASHGDDDDDPGCWKWLQVL